jgi:predicted nucleic acid-binding protein
MTVFKNISCLTNHTQPSSVNYFVDANIWIYAMQDDSLLNRYELLYFNFFYKIIDSELTVKPKILLPVLLFSEIVNSYLRNIALPEYKAEQGIHNSVSFNFKKDYRFTSHYKNSYKKVCDDIMALRDSIIFISDNSIIDDPTSLLDSNIGEFDFNDYFYYQLCKEHQKENKIIILTNDGDFRFSDIPIITLNREILDLRGTKTQN